MFPRKTILTSIVITFVLFALNQVSLAQNQLADCTQVNASKDYYVLGTKIGELNSEIRQKELESQQLQAKMADAVSDKEITANEDELKKLEQKPNQTPIEEERLRFLRLKLQNAISKESLTKQIAEVNKALEDKRTLARCIQTRLSTIFSPEQEFKLYMSIAFAFLIGLVIIGFFWLSLKDAIMRRAIFSGQTGIQFLTLFSIVIAIILFGITGILQDKELAALIGGISGYILGRYSSPSPTPSPSFMDRFASITITPNTLSLTQASPSAQLKAIPKDQSGNEIKDDENAFKPQWKSSDPGVAKVDQSGLVMRVAVGSCTVTATLKNISSNPCTVTCT
jgi:uncharacterized protein YjdB